MITIEITEECSVRWLTPRDVLHRLRRPAHVRLSLTGKKLGEHYLQHGDYHREGKPALIDRHPTGQKAAEIYYFRGRRHRKDGPAWSCWDRHGVLMLSSSYNNGERTDRVNYELEGEYRRLFPAKETP